MDHIFYFLCTATTDPTNPFVKFFNDIGADLYRALIQDNRYQLILSGLKNTIIITIFAGVLGIIIGTIAAISKVMTADNRYLSWIGKICDFYTTVVRGTPVIVQLLIMYNFILLSVDNEILVAILTFGFNSGAYVAELIRAGISAVDKGQTEAGRSLGLSATTTMGSIVLPQAIKNILPGLGNEFIALLKETSVVGYIAVRDLTKAADGIVSRTMSITPMFIVAVVYLALVALMTWGLRKLERRLNKSDKR